MSAAPRLRQVCLVAPALAPLEPLLADILDLHVVHRDPNLARYGLENRMLAAGPRFIEIVAPIETNTAAGRFLERSQGRGGYMAIFDCADPGPRADHAARLGVPVINRLHHESYTGRQLHPKHCRAAMIEFNHTEGGEALDGPYWPAGPHWQQARPSGVVQRLTGIELCSPEPETLARHWSRILQCTPDAADPRRIDSGGAELRFVAGDDTREYLGALRLAVTDPARALDSARRLGLAIATDRFRLAGVDWVLETA